MLSCSHTIISHDVLHTIHIHDFSGIPSEYLCSWCQLIGEVKTFRLDYPRITTEVVDLFVEGHIVGWPITCYHSEACIEEGYVCMYMYRTKYFVVHCQYVLSDFDRSDDWHYGYGGSVWTAPLDYVSITLGVMKSKDDLRFSFRFGYDF